VVTKALIPDDTLRGSRSSRRRMITDN